MDLRDHIEDNIEFTKSMSDIVLRTYNFGRFVDDPACRKLAKSVRDGNIDCMTLFDLIHTRRMNEKMYGLVLEGRFEDAYRTALEAFGEKAE